MKLESEIEYKLGDFVILLDENKELRIISYKPKSVLAIKPCTDNSCKITTISNKK